MRITFLGAVNTVTGSKFLVEYSDKKILIDCGLFQGLKNLRTKNWESLTISAKDIDYVLLTHAHIDHSGYIPRLVKDGFKGKIFCTPGTFQLCQILLPDSGNLQEEDANRANKYGYSKHKVALPLYTEQEAHESLKYFHPIDYFKKFDLFDHVSFEFIPAGHIIGSSMINLRIKKKKIVFSGDLGRLYDEVMNPPSSIVEADYLVVESTYGNRLHDSDAPNIELKKVIDNIVTQKSVLVIPSFAVGRAQSIIFHINQLKQQKLIADIPIYLDSPMSIDATDIFLKNKKDHKLTNDEVRMFHNVHYVNSPQDSKKIEFMSPPFILISASGMATGGRILHHLVTFGKNPKNIILFCGYQAQGTRGESLIKGEREIKIYGEYVQINAQVKVLNSLSSHADYSETLKWLESFQTKPTKTFIVHGEQAAAESLRKKISEKFKWECVVPDYKDVYKL